MFEAGIDLLVRAGALPLNGATLTDRGRRITEGGPDSQPVAQAVVGRAEAVR
jgi:hypothetical protein